MPVVQERPREVKRAVLTLQQLPSGERRDVKFLLPGQKGAVETVSAKTLQGRNLVKGKIVYLAEDGNYDDKIAYYRELGQDINAAWEEALRQGIAGQDSPEEREAVRTHFANTAETIDSLREQMKDRYGEK